MRIGIISDTHGYLNPIVLKHFVDMDEIWHAGDIGDLSIIKELELLAPVRAVYGNIDNVTTRYSYPEILRFETGGKNIMLTHIGGYPGKYAPGIKRELMLHRPNIFVCGHSHILKVKFDKDLNLLHVNPGAAGFSGFHGVSTIVKFTISDTIKDMEVVEFPKRKV